MSQTMWAFDYDLPWNLSNDARVSPNATLSEALAIGRSPYLTVIRDQQPEVFNVGEVLDDFAFDCAERTLNADRDDDWMFTEQERELLLTLRSSYCRGTHMSKREVRFIVLEHALFAYQHIQFPNKILVLHTFLSATGYYLAAGSKDYHDSLITLKVFHTIRRAATALSCISRETVSHCTLCDSFFNHLAERLLDPSLRPTRLPRNTRPYFGPGNERPL